MKILYNTLKSGGTKEHFRQVKVPGTVVPLLIERPESLMPLGLLG